jgi:hypothetical protein
MPSPLAAEPQSAFRPSPSSVHHFDRALAGSQIAPNLFEIDKVISDMTTRSDPDQRGLARVQAEAMTHDQKRAFSKNLDACATWFARAYWQAGI